MSWSVPANSQILILLWPTVFKSCPVTPLPKITQSTTALCDTLGLTTDSVCWPSHLLAVNASGHNELSRVTRVYVYKEYSFIIYCCLGIRMCFPDQEFGYFTSLCTAQFSCLSGFTVHGKVATLLVIKAIHIDSETWQICLCRVLPLSWSFINFQTVLCNVPHLIARVTG